MQRRILWLTAGIMGGALALMSFGGGLLAMWLVFAGTSAPTVAETLPVACMIGLGLGTGISLMLHSWAAWQARPSRPFNPSRVWLTWLVWILLVGLGTLVSSLPLASAWLLPPIHILTMSLPPLIILWSVGRALRGLGGSWREVIVGMVGGGTLGIGGSLIGEALVVLVLVGVAIVVTPLMPDEMEQIAALADGLQDPSGPVDMTSLMQLLLSPPIAISVLGIFSIPVPLIEEIFKTLAAGVVVGWVRPHPARAFLWGVASGAGFALAENLFNGALGGAEGWAIGAIARFGATTMHCAAGGLVGWGWGQLWVERRILRLLGAYIVAVIVHGVWNAATVSAALLSAGALIHGDNNIWLAIAGLGMLAALSLLLALTVTFVFALPLAGRRLAAKFPGQDGTVDPGEQAPGLTSIESLAS